MRTMLYALAIAAIGCGGGKKPEDTTSGGVTIDPNATSGDTTDRSGSMVPPEKMDEINRLLDRKRPAVSRCLTMAIDGGELPKASRGRITLGLTISPAGKAETIKVVKASLESQQLTDCVIGKVREIQFPEIPRDYRTSYTYAFEAIQ